jgi:hypothetical protein
MRRVGGLLFLLLLVNPCRAIAQLAGDPQVASTESVWNEGLARNGFGTSDPSTTAYTGDEFEPVINTSVIKAAGILEFTGPGLQIAILPMHLETGVLMDGVFWWAFDFDGDSDLQLRIYSLCWPFHGGDATMTVLASGTTSGIGDQAFFTSIDPPVTIDNGPCNYFVEVRVPNGVPTIKFRRVRVRWFRQVGAAPASATFADVSPTHPYFRFVEALASSGITAGCGDGNFCPDSPMTRGQMAVFLSVALGLHFPSFP